jgi:hypothetical protein
MRTSKVVRIFVGETEQHLLASKNDYQRICSLRELVKLSPGTFEYFEIEFFRITSTFATRGR